MNMLLVQNNISLSIDQHLFMLDQIKIESKVFDPNSLISKPIESFQLIFYSPTFIRQNNIISLLPEPTKFLMSSFDKMQKQ